MKKSIITVFALICFTAAQAQETPKVTFPKVDASSLDVVYYPLNTTKSKENISPVMRVIYSRPLKKGREIFGVLEQYDKVWRLGANENTEIQFFKQVKVGDKKIKAGRYSIFAIPTKEKWTIIINKKTDKWGAFSYNKADDVVRLDVPVIILDKVVEAFSITFVENTEGADLVFAWDKTQASLPIQFSK